MSTQQNRTSHTFMHLEMGTEFLVCAKGLGTVPVITLVRFCPWWSMFVCHVGS
jgi:hypothetical protein